MQIKLFYSPIALLLDLFSLIISVVRIGLANDNLVVGFGSFHVLRWFGAKQNPIQVHSINLPHSSVHFLPLDFVIVFLLGRLVKIGRVGTKYPFVELGGPTCAILRVEIPKVRFVTITKSVVWFMENCPVVL